MNIVEGLHKFTRRLGTNIESYLKDLFESSEVEDFRHFKDWSEYRRFTKKYRKQEEESSTIRQLKEVFRLFKIIDKDDNFIFSFNNLNEFNLGITNNFITLIENDDFLHDLKKDNKNISQIYINTIFSNLLEINRLGKIELNKDQVKKIESNSGLFDRFKEFNLTKRTNWFELLNDKNIKNLKERAYDILNTYGIDDSLFQKNISNKVKVENLSSYNKIKIEDEVKSYTWSINEFFKRKLSYEFDTLVIPFFQREYVWTEDLVEDLLVSIISYEDYLNIGSFLIRNKRIHDSSESVLIDGQQRLTTLLLIKNYLSKRIDHNDDFNKMIQNIENRSNKDYLLDIKNVLNVDINEIDKRGFDTKNNIAKNYKKIHNFLSEYTKEELEEIYKKFDFIIATIISDNKSNEIDLFINMNSKRKELSNYDLIRSFIIGENEKHSENDSSVLKKLDKLSKLLMFENQNQINNKEADVFFELFNTYENIKRMSQISFLKGTQNLFKNFKSIYKIYFDKNVSGLLESIIKNLETYRLIKGIERNENIYIDDFVITLVGKGFKRSSIYNIFFMEYINRLREESKNITNETSKTFFYEKVNKVRKIFMLLEKFEIKWKILNFHGDSLTQQMISLLKRIMINKSKDWDTLYDDFLDEFSINESNFMHTIVFEKEDEDIRKFEIISDELIQKILYRVSFNLYNNNSFEISKNSKNYYQVKEPSIEHIFPRKYSKWSEENEIVTNELVNHLEEIGNKLIFDKSENSSLGNKVFSEKKNGYLGWNEFKQDRTFDIVKQTDSWNAKKVKQRTNFVLNELIKIWNNLK